MSSHASRPILLRALPAALAALIVAATLEACGGTARDQAPTDAAATATHEVPAAASTASPSASSTPQPTSRLGLDAGSLEATLAALRQATLAPGAFAVVVDGTSRVEAVSGTRSLHGAPVTASDRFRIGSITKPIVAALVLISIDRGELGLDDVVGDRLPGVLRPTPAVTVRQLLAHTSGVFDELNEGNVVADAARLPDPGLRRAATDLLARYAKGERVLAPDRLIVALAETHERYFAPGAGYHYSNTNYQVLAMLLQKATGKSLSELLRTRIVTPLGLRSTTVAPADQTSPDLRGYDTTTTGAMTDTTDDLSLYGNGANGGVVTTADELLTILRATVTAKLFPASLVAEMERPVLEWYGLGLATYTFHCGSFLGHGGSVSGTQSIAVVSPDGARGTVVAINVRSGGDPNLPNVADEALCGGSALASPVPQG